MKLLISLVCLAVSHGQTWHGWSGWGGAPLATTYTAAQPDAWVSDGRTGRSDELLGFTADSYSYIDTDGQVQTVHYAADGSSAAMLRMAAPTPVQDTAEVKAAKQQFMAAFRMAEKGHMPMQDQMHMLKMAMPMPVQDTPEVAAAKAEFMAKYREAEMRQRKKRSLVVGLSHTPASTALLPRAVPLLNPYWTGLY